MKTIHSVFILLALFISACASQPKPYVFKNYEEQSDDLEGTVFVAYAMSTGRGV